MFYSIKELVEQADKDFNGNIAELMIATEMELSGRSRDEIIHIMTKNLQVMKNSVTDGLTPSKSISGLTGGDAVKMDTYLKSGKTLSDTTILTAVRNAIAVNELNAKMGLVCATPTAGSAGCLPAVLTTAIDKLKLSEEEQLNFLFTAGAFGLVIGNNASISGAEGGCQAEVGSASAMSAAALLSKPAKQLLLLSKICLGLSVTLLQGLLKSHVLNVMLLVQVLHLWLLTWHLLALNLKFQLTKLLMLCIKLEQVCQLPFVKLPKVA